MWMSEDNVVKLVLCSHLCMGLGIQLRSFDFPGNCFSPLNHLTGSVGLISYEGVHMYMCLHACGD